MPVVSVLAALFATVWLALWLANSVLKARARRAIREQWSRPAVVKGGEADPARMKLLVTGGRGFIGSKIVEWLLADDELQAHVVVVDVSPCPAEVPPRTTHVQLDLRNLTELRPLVQGVRAVLHVAAILPAARLLYDQECMSVSRQGTSCVVEASRAANVQALIYASSVAALMGEDFDGKTVYEGDESPESFSSVYARSKATGEKIVLQANSSDLATCALRLGAVFGPPQCASYRKQAHYTDEKLQMPWVHVDEVARGFVLATRALTIAADRCRQQVAGRAFHLSCDIADPLATVARFMGSQPAPPSTDRNHWGAPLAKKSPLVFALAAMALNTVLGKHLGWAPLGEMITWDIVQVVTISISMDTTQCREVLGWVHPPLEQCVAKVLRSLLEAEEQAAKRPKQE